MNPVQCKRHDADGDSLHQPGLPRMVEPSGIRRRQRDRHRGRRASRARALSRPGTHQGHRRQAAPRTGRQRQPRAGGQRRPANPRPFRRKASAGPFTGPRGACGILRARHAAAAFLPPLPRNSCYSWPSSPASSRARPRPARGRSPTSSPRPPSGRRRRPLPGARGHRHRVRVPRNRAIAGRLPGPDAVDGGRAARPRRRRRLRSAAACRRWRRLPAPTHLGVRDRARAGRLQRRALRRAARQRHPGIRGDAHLRAGCSRPRPISCRCAGAPRNRT